VLLGHSSIKVAEGLFTVGSGEPGTCDVTLLRLMLCQLIRAEIIGFEPFASAKPDASSSVVPAAQGKQFCPLP
jgi:hypothetical protein